MFPKIKLYRDYQTSAPAADVRLLSFVGRLLLIVGRSSVVDRWSVVCCWSLVGRLLLVVGRSSVVGRWSFVVGRLSLVGRLLLVVGRSSVVGRSLVGR